jgi:transposase-like protein
MPASAADQTLMRRMGLAVPGVSVLWVAAAWRFKLSLRDLVEMMAERGLSLAHTTIMRWVQRYRPEFEKRWHRYALAVGQSWRADETYVKIKGDWSSPGDA